jgi:hypothetical protein
MNNYEGNGLDFTCMSADSENDCVKMIRDEDADITVVGGVLLRSLHVCD